MTEHGSFSGLTVGTPVYTADGTHLGKVKEIEGDFFKLDAPVQPDYWLRLDQVRGAMNDGVALGFYESQIDGYRLSSPDETAHDADAPA